jgi:glycerol-3-phosphate acyltransferase PlsY
MSFWIGVLGLLMGYLFGSVNSAIVVCRLMGLPSPRSVGSGNPGATNVLRLGSKKAAALTLLGDVVKGILPVLLAHAMHFPSDWLAAVALAAVLGHAFPCFFGFKGGKGVATGLGVLLALHPILGLLTLLTWLVVAFLFRYSSLAALVSVILTPVYGYFFWTKNAEALWVLIVMAAFILFRHQANIRRLLSGKESRIGQKTAS